MAVKPPQTPYVDEPSKTTPLNAARLNYTEQRATEAAEAAEAAIAAGALIPQTYGATGNGVTDDTNAINTFLKEAKSKAGVFPPGNYKVTGELKVPPESDIKGVNGHSVRIQRSGNGKTFVIEEGATKMSNILVEALAEQTSGSAFSLLSGGDDTRLVDITLGSNFFNGFELIPSIANGGSIHLQRIRVVGITEGVKGIKGAVFVLGSADGTRGTHRMIGAIIDDVQGVAVNKAGVHRWLEANNTDTCCLSNILFQNGEQGVVVGNSDSSAEKTTNMEFHQVVCDGGAEGFNQGWLLEQMYCTDITACHSQGGEVYMGQNLHGLTWTGGAMQFCPNNGLRVGNTGVTSNLVFVGVKIGNNNQRAGVKVNPVTSEFSADVLLEKTAERVLFVACPVGNIFNYGNTCFSSYGFWFQGNATEGPKFIAARDCPYIKLNNSGAATEQKAFINYLPTPTREAQKVYGFTNAAGEAIPTPLAW